LTASSHPPLMNSRIARITRYQHGQKHAMLI
jgi:hypothetical protein